MKVYKDKLRAAELVLRHNWKIADVAFNYDVSPSTIRRWMDQYRGREEGSASLLIVLGRGEIQVYHGTDHGKLGEKKIAVKGDWDKLIASLKELGIEWQVTQ